MSKTEEKKAAPAAPPESLTKSLLGYVLGAGLGLVVLLGLSKLLTSPPARLVDELPHLTVLVDILRPLGDQEVRSALVRLQRELIALDLSVVGPLNYPVLVPPAVAGQEPIAKDLDQLSLDELGQATPYWGVGGYLVPRVFSSDHQTAILRAAPAGARGRFPSGTDVRVRELCERFEKEGLLRPRPYSYALSLLDEETKARTNVVFGVQTAIVEAQSPAKKLAGSALVQQQIYTELQQFKSNPRVRTITSEGTFVHYATAVTIRMADTPATAALAWDRFMPLARKLKLPALSATDGTISFIEVTTDAEGPDNRTLCYSVASALQPTENVSYYVRRVRSN